MNLGFLDSIRFLGRVTPVTPYFLAADVFTLLSVSEGMSIVFWKPWRAACPGFLSDIPATGHLSKMGQEGLLVPVGRRRSHRQGDSPNCFDSRKTLEI